MKMEAIKNGKEGILNLTNEPKFATVKPTEKEKNRAKQTFHATANEAAIIAQKSKVHKLLLGHFSARYESADCHLNEAKIHFENVICAEDGLTIEL